MGLWRGWKWWGRTERHGWETDRQTALHEDPTALSRTETELKTELIEGEENEGGGGGQGRRTREEMEEDEDLSSLICVCLFTALMYIF